MVQGRDMLGASSSPVQQLARLVDSVTDYAIFLLDPEGHVLTWNAGAERTKGYTAGEIIGEHFSVFYMPEDRERGHPGEALATAGREGRFEEESWRVRKDGARFWANVLIMAVHDDSGNLVGYGKVTRDLTERRIARQELELFASSAAHDLQEPLRTIVGFSDLLVKRHADTLAPDAREFVEHISSAAGRMKRLISDLLAYARSGPGEVTRVAVPLAAAAEVAVANVHGSLSDRGIEVGIDIPADASVLADTAGVALLLQNLLSNAVKFADHEGPEVGLSVRREGAEWLVAVTDNGPGVPEAQRQRIFEPFTQLRRDDFGGTGLGLAIAQRIAERDGGRIGVDSAPGSGSRFWFALPAA